MEVNKALPLINMSNWKLHCCGTWFYLSGTADNHPKLGINARVVHTSEVLNGIVEGNEVEEVYRFTTHNSIYVCPLKYMSAEMTKMEMNLDALDNIELIKIAFKLNKKLEDTIENKKLHETLKRGQIELKHKQKLEENRLMELMHDKKNTIYLEVSSIGTGDTLAYNINDKIGIIKPSIHVGTFQDSILYMEDGLVDFRYFPMMTAMEIYSWSDNIDKLLIKNMKQYDIRVDEQIIKPGETVEIDKNNYKYGLISPNCVDGSSAFFN